MISLNPFKSGTAVTGKYFTDREEEIKTLLLDLAGGQNVILYSPRRFGKTSLVLEVISRLRKEGCLCIYVDLFPISSKRDFAQRLASAIAKDTSKRIEEVARKIKDFLPKITPKIVLKGETNMEFDLEFEERELDVDRLLASLYDLPQNIAQKRNKRVVMVFDEFQQIGQINGEEIEKGLRTKIQHHNDVAYVFMGSKRHLMHRIFNDRSRPFYKIGKTFTLRKIPKEKFAAFIIKRLESTGMRIESPLIEEILEITEGHPHYTQMLMHEVWNESYPGKIITSESIKMGLEQVFLHEGDAFIALWDSLSPRQKNLLVALASDENIPLHSQAAIIKYELGSPATVSKSLKVLKDKEFLEQEGGKYIFSDIFFKEWIRRQL
ncbi:MAG: ATP-binding protein [bacterium]|nr:ATP-binding protein [bacterium]